MKIEDRYIESAIQALTTASDPIVKKAEETYNSQFKGYIAAFGASLVQAGLLSTVILYENSPSAQQDKKKLISAIRFILEEQNGYRFGNTKLSRYLIDRPEQRPRILTDIEKAAIAVKLALRMFSSTDNQEE